MLLRKICCCGYSTATTWDVKVNVHRGRIATKLLVLGNVRDIDRYKIGEIKETVVEEEQSPDNHVTKP